MKKNEVFTFTAPNGAEVTGIAIEQISSHYNELSDTINDSWLCYAQNRLFRYDIVYGRTHAYPPEEQTYIVTEGFGKHLVDYAILPDHDGYLHDYFDAQEAQAETNLGM